MEYVRVSTINASLRPTFFVSYSIQDGTLIDFSNMKAFSYNQTSNTVIIQPGALWGDIYDGLQSKGVSVVGGRETFVFKYFLFS